MDSFKSFLVAWLPFIMAVINWTIVRYSKPDTKLPLNVPARLRPWIPVVLAVVAATLQRFVAGSSLADAVRTAVIGGLGPILTHELVSESILGGKEIPVPFMVKKPGDVSKLEVPVVITGGLLALLVGLVGGGCASWWANTPSHVIDVAKIVTCVMTEIDKEPPSKPADIAIKCGLENADAVLDLVKAQRAAEARHVKPGAPPPCASAAPSASSSK
jgi:hypothetical protein